MSVGDDVGFVEPPPGSDEGDRIPGLPNVPIIRHLTYREAHRFELGLYNGLVLAVALFVHRYALVAAVLSYGLRRIQDTDQEETREDLVWGFARDAWYFTVGVVVGFLLGVGGVAVLVLAGAPAPTQMLNL